MLDVSRSHESLFVVTTRLLHTYLLFSKVTHDKYYPPIAARIIWIPLDSGLVSTRPNNSTFLLPAVLGLCLSLRLWHRNHCPGQFLSSGHSCSAHTGDRTGSRQSQSYWVGERDFLLLSSPSPKSGPLRPKPKANPNPSPIGTTQPHPPPNF